MKVALAQFNPVVGDVENNLHKLLDAFAQAAATSVDLIVFPELYLCGYPPRDLLNYEWFLNQLDNALLKILEHSKLFPEVALLVGTARKTSRREGKSIYNSAVLIANGNILLEQHKQLLPTYDVFDERRYFEPGITGHVIQWKQETLGISICEDAWNDPDFDQHREYDRDPIELLIRKGATLLVNISASPYYLGKEDIRFERFANHARKWRVPMLLANQVGANDEIIFDGNSLAITRDGTLFTSPVPFEEQLIHVDTHQSKSLPYTASADQIRSLHDALVLGLRDYMRKCGFKSAVIGLSGGIDSAVTACLAVDAIGNENVIGVTMPSGFSSSGSVDDSIILSNNLNIRCDKIPIHPLFEAYRTELASAFQNTSFGVAEENLQARIRGNLLMAYSNKFGGIVLTTGNKSELAVGYCTLYGDMSGGLAVISDLPKTLVYKLAEWYNREREIIPNNILTKPPSAELRPNQTDQDTLPDYDSLDQILNLYLEELWSVTKIVQAGFQRPTVEWVVKTVDRNEYKRKQAAPGLKVTTKAFGIGRRMPIAANWNRE